MLPSWDDKTITTMIKGCEEALESVAMNNISGLSDVEDRLCTLALAYLLQDDNLSPRFLYKRICSCTGTSFVQLEKTKRLAETLASRSFAEFFQLLDTIEKGDESVIWNYLKNALKMLRERTRLNLAVLMEQSFASVSVSSVHNQLGLSEPDAALFCTARGWIVEEGFWILTASESIEGKTVGAAELGEMFAGITLLESTLGIDIKSLLSNKN